MRPRSRHRFLVLLPLLLLLLAGCGADGDSRALAEESSRIVSLAPSLTEIVFALGASERLVGVTDFCDYPPEAKDLPSLGGFRNLNLETVLRLSPDLALTLTYDAADAGKSLKDLGIPVLSVPSERVGEVLGSIRIIGERLGREKEAESLVAGIEEELRLVEVAVSSVSRPRVLLVAGRDPQGLADLYAAGPDSFLGEIVELSGGTNVVLPSSISFPTLSKEAIVVADPQVIIELPLTGVEAVASEEERAEVWSQLPTLSAVKNRRIHVLRGNAAMRPGPRMAEVVRELFGILHPAVPEEKIKQE